MQLSRFPRVRFAHVPTPLEDLPNLTRILGGPRILIKRDDATGLAFGGNKTRKLEFLMADALAKKADTIITTGAIQSNHCRQTAAAAAKLGMRCILVLVGEELQPRTGNLLLDHLLGAETRIIPMGADVLQAMQRVGDEISAVGKRPYLIPTGGSNEIGSLGYVSVALEIEHQANDMDIAFDYVVAASSSAGTQTGLVVGFEGIGSGVQVLGIAVGGKKEEVEGDVYSLAQNLAEMLQLGKPIPREKVLAFDAYLGPGYGIPTPGMIEAVKLLATNEGILLDPVYTGKAMAGLIDLIRNGYFERDATVVFVHTGGTPALFAYESVF